MIARVHLRKGRLGLTSALLVVFAGCSGAGDGGSGGTGGDGGSNGDADPVEAVPLVSCQSWQSPGDQLDIATVGANGLVYVSSDNELYALALTATGFEERWHIAAQSDDRFHGAAMRVANFYATTKQSQVYKLVPHTGDERWRLTKTASELGPPAIGSDGTVYIRSLDNFLYALEPTAGSDRWFTDTGQFLNRPVLGDDDTVYVVTLGSNGPLWAIEPADGLERWLFEPDGMGNYEIAEPAIGGDGSIIVYVRRDSGNQLYSLQPNRTVNWTVPVADNSGPAVGPDGTIYLATLDGELVALDPLDGSDRWRSSFGSSTATGKQILLVGDNPDDHLIVVLVADGDYHRITAKGSAQGDTVWFVETTDEPSTLGADPDGHVYAANSDGALHALDCP